MGRWNLKTCLFGLIALVVGLTILFIAKFQPSSAGLVNIKNSNNHWDSPQSLTGRKDEDLSIYYNNNGINGELNDNNNNNKVPKKNPKRNNNNNKIVDSVGNSLHNNAAGDDYPFEDDFINQEEGGNTNNNNDKLKKHNKDINKDTKKQVDFDGYVGLYSFKDDDNNNNNKINNDNNENNKIIKSSDKTKNKNNLSLEKERNFKLQRTSSITTDITCDINNGKYVLDCKKEDNEVYVPFSFLKKYFEVSGKMSDKDDTKFLWLHSQAKIYRSKVPYDPSQVFTYFENYNVEVRDRVKCVSGVTGVPVSTQWDRNGYFYPIQIAQFGLAHYSKSIVESEPERIILENGDNVRGKWIVQSKSNVVVKPEPLHSFNHIIQIQHSSPNQPATLKMTGNSKTPRLLTLSWDMKTDTLDSLNEETPHLNNLNVTLTATVKYENQMYYLHYITTDLLISAQDNHIYHGLGQQSFSKWQHVIRDLGVDVQKGVSLLNGNNHRKSAAATVKKIIKSKLIVESISISLPQPSNPDSPTVRLYLDNMTLSTSEHLAQFFQTADWFVREQDEAGGWPIPVRRKFASDFYPVLESGWYSAMAQGHGLSLLARAYSVTKKQEYANACAKAVKQIFDLPGKQAESNTKEYGVKAVFMDKFTWYEEYPTIPSTFVLNGFMYALLGLYDVKTLKIPGAHIKAGELYDAGLISLKTMLPLFDTGSGTMYDLRHFTVPGITPNPARLDYHVTHINQLLTFASFEKDPIFSITAERWIDYTEGNRAPHN